MTSLDTATWQLPFRKCSRASTTQLLLNARITHRLFSGKQMRLGVSWKDQFQLLNIINIKAPTTIKEHLHVVNAVAIVEPSFLVHNQDGQKIASSLELETSSQMLLASVNDDSGLNDREKLRRSRISKANKGNVPWNKGRKHSPETLQRIRERTRLAMQDPKVKVKLANIGHAQSDETRLKIGIGVREGWQRRREKLMMQETCHLDWQNIIAEASRKGYHDEEELQWDSYKILDKELKKQWEESVEKRKTMPRPKGSKRAPKTLEQRKKISEAISAKWADPGYRDRVCSALSKYHGTLVGAEKEPRRKRTDQPQSPVRVRVKKKPNIEDVMFESKFVKKSKPEKKKKKKSVFPMYKDPMASTKLEMIKKIKAQRTEMENRKREATQRAKLLIAEAEKAAEALEVAALKSPLARASLLETRKLIAEATRAIESIDKGEIALQENGNSTSPSRELTSGHTVNYPGGSLVDDTLAEEETLIVQAMQSPEGTTSSQDNRYSSSPDQEATVRHPPVSSGGIVGGMLPVVEKVNGKHQLSPTDRSVNDFDFEFDKLTLQNAVNGSQPLPDSRKAADSTGGIDKRISPPQVNNASERSASDGTLTQVGFLKLKGKYNKRKQEDNQVDEVDNCKTTVAKTKKKWICGRLVEVEED